jgi:glutaredoxin
VATTTLTLYTREGCHLCDDALAVVERVRDARPFELRVVDIDHDLGPGDARFATYTNEVPVIEVNGRKAFKFRVEPAALSLALDGAREP